MFEKDPINNQDVVLKLVNLIFSDAATNNKPSKMQRLLHRPGHH